MHPKLMFDRKKDPDNNHFVVTCWERAELLALVCGV